MEDIEDSELGEELGFEEPLHAERVVRYKVRQVIADLIPQHIEVAYEKHKTSGLSNMWNILNGKLVGSVTKYKFITPNIGEWSWDDEEIVANLTIERGFLKGGGGPFQYRKTKLIFPRGLQLKTGRVLPKFGIDILEKNLISKETRRRDYFLKYPFNTPADFKNIIPTHDLILSGFYPFA